MSKVKVKFIYGGEHTVAVSAHPIEVNEARNGPINWNNVAEINTIGERKSEIHVQPAQLAATVQDPSILEFVEKPKTIEKKPSLNTYKSAETLPSVNAI
jgi:hypothetical protein